MKKPVIDYGWKIPKKVILCSLIFIILIFIYIFNYKDKTDASYIANELHLYTRLNISKTKNIKLENIDEDIIYGIVTKANLYSDNYNTIDNYIGSIEVFKNESLSRIRRTTLKHSNNYIKSRFNTNLDYINNRTYDIYIYQNVILKLNSNVKSKEEYFEDIKEILKDVTLENQRTLSAKETEDLIKKINIKLEIEINKDYNKYLKNKYFNEF